MGEKGMQRWHRRWIKMYPVPCLEGSIRWQLEADERGVWYDLVMFAALCPTPGLIADSNERAYPTKFIASRLSVNEELLKRTLDKCEEEGRVKVNSTGIHIVNWGKYQSEYERQKPYRDAKKEGTTWEEQIRNISSRPAQFIAEALPRNRARVLALLDKENPHKAKKVRKLIEEAKNG